MDEECDGHRVQPEQGCEALPHRLTVLGAHPDPVCLVSAGKLFCLLFFSCDWPIVHGIPQWFWQNGIFVLRLRPYPVMGHEVLCVGLECNSTEQPQVIINHPISAACGTPTI